MNNEHNFQFDHRTLAYAKRWWIKLDGGKALANMPIPDDEWAETEEKWITVKFEVCPTCQGKGTHVDPNVDAGGLTQEDFDDPDFKEDYLSGRFNVSCNHCNGMRVVPVPSDEEDAKAIEGLLIEKMESARETASELAMGA